LLKVLIVDDEPIILEGLMCILNWQELGLEIAGACANGAEAAAFLKSKPVDIVITDIKMPEVDGIDLIRHIRKRNYACKCIVLSSFNDFQYVKEAALLGIENYLLKPVSTQELISTLENAIEKIESEMHRKSEQAQEKYILRDNVVYRWLNDDIEWKELENRSPLLGIDLYGDSFVAAMIKLAYDENRKTSYRIEDKRLLKFAAHNICGELISAQGIGIAVTDMNGDQALLFMRNTDATVVRGILQECLAQMNALLGIDAFATVGSQQSGYRQVRLSYSQAKSIQSFQLLYGYNKIVHYDEVLPLLCGTPTLPDINPTRLRDILSGRDVASLDSFFAEVSAQLRDEKHFSISHVQHAVMELVFHLTSAMYDLSPRPELFFERHQQLIQRVYRMDTVHEITQSLTDIAKKAIAYLEELEDRISPFIRRVIGYIHNHFADNIDLQNLAHEYKINAMYLGQCFKKETGETITNYVNRVRIEHAKRLLRETRMKTNEIAEQVGYVNVNYFPTIFKKLVGKTPSEYQKDAVAKS